MEHFKYIINGEDPFAVNLATKLPNHLLIGNSILPGGCFNSAFNPGSQESYQSLPSCRLSDELIKRNALLDGRLHLPALPVVLAHFITEAAVNCRFNSHVIKAEHDGKNWLITISGDDGLTQVTSEYFIDAVFISPLRKYYMKLGENIVAKKFNALLCLEADFDGQLSNSGEIIRGRFDDEGVFKIPVAPDCNFTQARQAMTEFWRRQPETIPCHVVATASDFELKTTNIALPEIQRNLLRIAVWNYPNPVAAFAAADTLIKSGELK